MTETQLLNTYYGKYELKRVHPYKFKNIETGEILSPPGVTTICGMLSKDAIPQWAANEAARYAIDNHGMDKDLLYELSRKRYIELRDDAADGGTSAHAWIEDYLADKLQGSYCFESEAGINLIESFLKWESDNPFDSHESEQILLSMNNLYAGTRDDLATRDGLWWTLDFKTGSPDFEYDTKLRRYTGRARPYSAHLMQCAAYDIAESEMNGRISSHYGIVYLVKDPKKLKQKYGIEVPYFFFTTDNTLYWQRQFLDARDLYDSNLNNPYKEMQ